MSQFVDGNTKTFEADEAIAQYLRVKFDADGKITTAGATDLDIGETAKEAYAAGDYVAVRMRVAAGTHKLVAAGAITRGNVAYGAAGGKVASTANGNPIGLALETTTANNDVLEVIRMDALEEMTGDDAPQVFGTGSDAQLMWSTGDASNHSFVVALGNSNQAVHVTDVGAIATDWNVAADTHPTVYIHSNTTPATDYVKIGAHSGTAAWLGDVVGAASAYIGFDGLECLEFVETASAVNHIGLTNAATTNAPAISAIGTDTNVSINVTPKGTGDVNLTTGHVTMGDGGTVTQITSITTGVTLNTESGQITTVSSTLAAAAEATFTVTNDRVAATDVVICNLASTSSAGTPVCVVSAVAAGSFDITITNLHASAALDNTLVINFAVIGGSAT